MKISWTVKELKDKLNELGSEYDNWEVISKEGTCFERIKLDKKYQEVILTNNCKYSRYDR